jgi:hypothetical protein
LNRLKVPAFAALAGTIVRFNGETLQRIQGISNELIEGVSEWEPSFLEGKENEWKQWGKDARSISLGRCFHRAPGVANLPEW